MQGILEMIKKWILMFIVFLGIAQPCVAQPESYHKKVSTYKRVTHTHSKHTVSHKIKHHPVHHSWHIHKEAVKPQSIASIPQPQFDTSDTGNTAIVNATESNFQHLPGAAPQKAAATEDDILIDPAQIDTSTQTLTALAYKTIETQRYSTYKLGANVFDPAQGIYKIDCSAYINDLLNQADPQAYSSLTKWTQTYRPTSHDYYNFITRLPNDEPTQHWRKVNNVGQLQPGGILVFLSEYLHKHHLYTGGGHVMLVMSNPVPHANSSDTYQVKVADSASSGHSDDTRLPHKSGIGIGTLLLKVDPFTGKPKAYAWSLGGRWRSHTLFAMAQPLGNV